MRCVVTGHGERWQAFCFDYDIAVEGRSLADAAQRLQDAIEGYEDTVATLPVCEQRALLGRQTPLLDRLRISLL